MEEVVDLSCERFGIGVDEDAVPGQRSDGGPDLLFVMPPDSVPRELVRSEEAIAPEPLADLVAERPSELFGWALVLPEHALESGVAGAPDPGAVPADDLRVAGDGDLDERAPKDL